MNVTVWSNPGCGPCYALKAALRAKGVPFVERSLADASAAQIVAWRALGYVQAPVVEHTGGTFAGFDPVKVRSLADARR